LRAPQDIRKYNSWDDKYMFRAMIKSSNY
jgi:hypothetical protein